jgi:GMP synthase-like glutamine amidotransferase
VRVLAIVHQPDAGPGVFAAAIRAGGHRLDEWLLPEVAEPPGDPHGYDAVLTLGGAMNADQHERHAWLAEENRLLAGLIERGTPLLGLCLGAQLVAGAAGATVRRGQRPEIGWCPVELTEEGSRDPLLAPLAPRFEAFQWHSYEFPLPAGAVPLALSEVCLQAARIGERAWAVQFHPEVSAADAAAWIDDYRADPDAVRIGLDPAAFKAETEEKIAAFNQLGRDLCARWLAQA